MIRTLRLELKMSEVDRESLPEMPLEVDTPRVVGDVEKGAKGAARMAGRDVPVPDEEEDEFEDASDAGEVFLRRDVHPHPVRNVPAPPMPTVSALPHVKPEDYDGTSDWLEYKVYFDQLAELYAWDEERKAMILGICLKGEARIVFASLHPAQRRSYVALTTALAQSFSPKELVYLYQAELKARRKRADESMANLGRDVAKLVRLAYPTADSATREVIGINAFLEALPGPASEMKLHVIKGRPKTLQEAVAHATEVDAVVEAENKRLPRRKGDCRMVGSSEEDLAVEVKKLKEDLEKTKEELKEAQRRGKKPHPGKRASREEGCFGCGEKGHFIRNCPNKKEDGAGNESRRLERQ